MKLPVKPLKASHRHWWPSVLPFVGYNYLHAHFAFATETKQHDRKFLLWVPETTINSTFSTRFPTPTPHIHTKTVCMPKITKLLFPERPPQNGLDTQLEKHQLSVRFNFL